MFMTLHKIEHVKIFMFPLWEVNNMTTITYPFAPTSLAALLDVEMPSTFSKIHSYILYRLQLPDWKLSKTDVANRFDISMSTVKRAFRWLREHGYLTHDGVNNWKVYPSSNLPMGVINEPLERVINEPLYIKVSLQRKEQQQPVVIAPLIATPMEIIPVVVSSESTDDLIYPSQIKDTTPLRKKLNKIKPEIVAKTPAIKQEVLFELAYRMSLQNLRSVPAFLNTLVTAVNDGTFTRTAAKDDAGGTISNQANIDATQEKLRQQRQSKASAPDVAKAGIASMFSALRGSS
jgi:DNA-binding transcriptional regulator YhcF (GntR family)